MSKQGKGSRAKNKARRKRERRARKESMQAQYQRWKERGINTKSKRQVKKKRNGPRDRKHTRACGNDGCQRCYGILLKPFLNSQGQPEGMPHWMFRLWQSLDGHGQHRARQGERVFPVPVTAYNITELVLRS